MILPNHTVADHEPHWPPRALPRSERPNIVMIVLDDTGWSDFGCFGSEIRTPAIDALANGGLRYVNFHVTPLCSPTRACLLTGRNHHRVGMRFLSDIDTGYPNARGFVNPGVDMIPKLLREAGYGTYLVGKWHLTPQHEITPAGPFGNWPLQRGFDRFYGFLDGCTDQFEPELYEDNHLAAPPLGPDYHLSADLADRAIAYVSDHLTFRADEPFFLTFAPGATHAPFQAPEAFIKPYEETFAVGWDAVRERRFARQKAMGLVPPETQLNPRNPDVPAWSELSADERRLFTRQQAAFAGFLEHCDQQIGRLIAHLEKLGVRDNTLIAVLSDNGASPEGRDLGAADTNALYSGANHGLAEQLERIDEIGGPCAGAHYPTGWAMAGNTPFRLYKQFAELGGVRSPLVVNWPARVGDGGGLRRQFAHAIDIAATVLDAAGTPAPGDLDGSSLIESFALEEAPAPRQTQYWEMMGHRAIWHEGWRAVTLHRTGDDYVSEPWRLYDTGSDFSEARDVAEGNRERLELMVSLWWRQAAENGVLPLDDRPLKVLLNEARSPYQLPEAGAVVLRPETGYVPVSTGVCGVRRPFTATARLVGRRKGEGGVLLASGGAHAGFAFYLDDRDRLCFDYDVGGERVSLVGTGTAPAGDAAVALKLMAADEGSRLAVLSIDGVECGRAALHRALAHPSFRGLEIGRAPRNPVSEGAAWAAGWRAGVLDHIRLDFAEPVSAEELAAIYVRTE